MLYFKGRNGDYAKCLDREKVDALFDWDQDYDEGFRHYTILSNKLAIKLTRLNIELRIFANTKLRQHINVP